MTVSRLGRGATIEVSGAVHGEGNRVITTLTIPRPNVLRPDADCEKSPLLLAAYFFSGD